MVLARDLIARLRSGDKKARDKLVEMCTPLVKRTAYRYDYGGLSGITREDLEQAGYMGVLKAIENYNPTHESGADFIAYASKPVKSYILDELLKSRTIRIPEGVVREYIKLRKEGGEIPDDILLALEVTGSSIQLEDSMATIDDFYDYDGEDRTQMVKMVLEQLPVRDRLVVSMRFGLDRPPRTLEEVGDILGVSYERVRQIEKDVLERLKVINFQKV